VFQQLVIHNTLELAVYVSFYLIEQHSKCLLHTLQVFYMCTLCDSTGLFKIIVGVLTNCHTQYLQIAVYVLFYLIEQHSKFLLHTLQVLYMCTLCDYTGLFEMIVCVLTTCHTQYTSDSSICFCLFNRTTLQVFVTYLTGALYVHPLWFHKRQHDSRVRSELFVACQRWWFQWRFWFVPSVPGYTRTLSLETMHIIFEWNCEMVVVSRLWCGIAAGQLYPDNRFE